MIGAGCARSHPGTILPALVASLPAAHDENVPVTAWIVLRFAEAPLATVEDFTLVCSGRVVDATLSPLPGDRVVVNPRGTLPAAAPCVLGWRGMEGPRALAFTTAAPAEPAIIPFDRDDESQVLPFPDDVFTVDDPRDVTGRRVVLAPPAGRNGRVRAAMQAVIHAAGDPDGFSPLGPWIVALPDAADPAALPMTAASSLDPLATVGLFDVDPKSPSYGARIPFDLWPRTDHGADGVPSSTLVVWPRPLEPRGRYALVVTRRALVDASRPFFPSPFFARALAAAAPGDSQAMVRERAALAALTAALAHTTPPLEPDDLAVAMVATIRDTESWKGDMLAIRADLDARAPWPAPEITVLAPDDPSSDVAAIVTGTWEVPIWVDGPTLTRDANGRPQSQASEEIGFVLALPRAALDGPVPLAIYQHGHPGSADEVPEIAARIFAPAGMAVVGFTDRANRQRLASRAHDGDDGDDDGSGDDATDVADALGQLLRDRSVGAVHREMWAEQLAFIRFLSSLSALDVLPLGAPDGTPDLDLDRPLTYLGVSYGAIYGVGLAAYAPELRAEALWVGAGRLSAFFLTQQLDDALDLGRTLGATPADMWWFFALAQLAYDPDDPTNHARFVFRSPADIPGEPARPSILLAEGLGDPLTSPLSTRAAAWQLEAAQLGPVREVVPYLDAADAPLAANLAADTTSAFFQYVSPSVLGVPPTPSCVFGHKDGHDCAQSVEGRRQIARFLSSAVNEPAPIAADPATLCLPDCAGRVCGPDGCGGLCAPGCPAGDGCAADGSACVLPIYEGNDRCDDALVIHALPFHYVGTTVGARADVTPAGPRCPDAGDPAGPDVVFAFTPTTSLRVEARLRTTAERLTCTGANAAGDACNPTNLFVTADCAAPAATCVGASFWNRPDGRFVFDAVAGQTTYIIIEGYQPVEVGSYTLEVTEPHDSR